MTTFQKVLVATIVVAAGAGLYETVQSSRLRTQIQALKQQQSESAQKILQFEQERDARARQLAAVRAENERLDRGTSEILKLRGELARLRSDSEELARRKVAEKQQGDNGDLLTAQSWLSRADTFRKWIAAHPDEQIPESQYLLEADWLDAVKNNNLAGEYAPRHAAQMLRERAKEEFANELSNALRRFVVENNGDLPTGLAQLNSHLSRPMSEDLIGSYKLLYSGNIADVPKGEWLVVETAQQEDPGHTHLAIGTNRWSQIR
jgi:hypothetical protein